MSGNGNGKLSFGDFKLDSAKRVVWHRGQPVDLPLKAVELLCLLRSCSRWTYSCPPKALAGHQHDQETPGTMEISSD